MKSYYSSVSFQFEHQRDFDKLHQKNPQALEKSISGWLILFLFVTLWLPKYHYMHILSGSKPELELMSLPLKVLSFLAINSAHSTVQGIALCYLIIFILVPALETIYNSFSFPFHIFIS